MDGATFRLAVLALAIISIPVIARSQQSQYPRLDELANKVIAKYQNSSCDQIAAQKQNPPTGKKAEMEQRVIQELKNNPDQRQYFINKVAGPIANKMFDCGMIP
jgi:hypothetical protein